MPTSNIVGTDRLAAIGRSLIEAGEVKVKRDMLAAIREEGKSALSDVPDSARSTLPRSGGLAEEVAHQTYTVRTSLAGPIGSVKLVGKGMKELRDINQGRLRHPVFNNRERWVGQTVPTGFFSDPIEAKAPEVREAILLAIERVAHEIAAV